MMKKLYSFHQLTGRQAWVLLFLSWMRVMLDLSLSDGRGMVDPIIWHMVGEEVDARMEDSGSSQGRIEDNALSRIREDHHRRASGSKHSRR
jgi:hypothetical protein